jgi:hypothetical protein
LNRFRNFVFSGQSKAGHQNERSLILKDKDAERKKEASKFRFIFPSSKEAKEN